MTPTTRSEAKLIGHPRFFTGVPCKHGHLSERLTVNGACYECERARKIRSYKTDGGREKSRLRSVRWLKNMDPERRKAHYEKQRNSFKYLGDNWKEIKREYYRIKSGLPPPTRPMPDACECCGKARIKEGRALCLDHCHDTGQFRGWLCDKCNRGLGFLGDSLESILKAVNYLTTATTHGYPAATTDGGIGQQPADQEDHHDQIFPLEA